MLELNENFMMRDDQDLEMALTEETEAMIAEFATSLKLADWLLPEELAAA